MRFISPDSRHTHTAIKPKVDFVQDKHGAKLHETDPGVECMFQQGGLLDWERRLAVGRFELKGLAEGEDPLRRFSVYDTELQQLIKGWSDERREEVEAALLQATDIMVVEKPKSAAPWPAYDRLVAQGRRTKEMVAEQIAAKVREDGYEPTVVCEYERENRNRQEVLDAVEAVVYEELSEEEILA